jgi:hypothetical protein
MRQHNAWLMSSDLLSRLKRSGGKGVGSSELGRLVPQAMSLPYGANTLRVLLRSRSSLDAEATQRGREPHIAATEPARCRTYPIRVGGDSGPMSQELDWEHVADRSRLDLGEILKTEKGSVSRNQRRVAEFDWT